MSSLEKVDTHLGDDLCVEIQSKGILLFCYALCSTAGKVEKKRQEKEKKKKGRNAMYGLSSPGFEVDASGSQLVHERRL
jgi:hypothetical protein